MNFKVVILKIKQTYIGWRFEIKLHCDSITILYTISVYYILAVGPAYIASLLSSAGFMLK